MSEVVHVEGVHVLGRTVLVGERQMTCEEGADVWCMWIIRGDGRFPHPASSSSPPGWQRSCRTVAGVAG